MIPDIGLMIGCYIITRMVFMANSEDASNVVKILCAVTILVAAFVMVDLFVRGTEIGLPR